MLTTQLSPLGFSPVALPGFISGPHRLPWPKSWLSLSVLQVLTHTSPALGLPRLIRTLSLERNTQFPVYLWALTPEYETISEVIFKILIITFVPSYSKWTLKKKYHKKFILQASQRLRALKPSSSAWISESNPMDSMDVSLSELRELVTDREASRAVIHGITKSWTRLSDWTELNLMGLIQLGYISFNYVLYVWILK